MKSGNGTGAASWVSVALVLAGLFLLLIVPALFSWFLLPKIETICMELGAELPELSKWAIAAAGFYRPPFSLLTIGLSIVAVALMAASPSANHNKLQAVALSLLFLLLSAAWCAFIVVGSYLPILRICVTVR